MKLNNKYYILRHGESLSNIKEVVSSWPEMFENPLTEAGVESVRQVAQELKNKKIDVIFSSDVLRAGQTAQIVAEALKLQVTFDARLREVGFGTLNGKTRDEVISVFSDEKLRVDQKNKFGSETYEEVLGRATDFLRDIDSRYHEKTILIVSHKCPLWLLEDFVKEIPFRDDMQKRPEEKRIGKGELRQLN